MQYGLGLRFQTLLSLGLPQADNRQGVGLCGWVGARFGYAERLDSQGGRFFLRPLLCIGSGDFGQEFRFFRCRLHTLYDTDRLVVPTGLVVDFGHHVQRGFALVWQPDGHHQLHRCLALTGLRVRARQLSRALALGCES